MWHSFKLKIIRCLNERSPLDWAYLNEDAYVPHLCYYDKEVPYVHARAEPGGARRGQEEPGGRSQEEPRGARRSQEEPGKPGKPEVARRSQEGPVRELEIRGPIRKLVLDTCWSSWPSSASSIGFQKS